MIGDTNLEAVRIKLEKWLKNKLPEASDLTLSPLKRPGAGRSNETYFLEYRWRQADEIKKENLVIRWKPQGYTTFPKYAYDMKKQYMLMKRLGDTDVPVPKALWLEEDESVIGSPFYIVERVDGWVPEEKPTYHESGPLFEATPEFKSKIWWGGIDTLAKINTLDWKKADLGFLGVPNDETDFIRHQIAFYDEVLRLNEKPPAPVLEATMDWLLKNIVVPKHVSLCWGDARIGNMIFRDGEPVSVLDWEMVCLGDPESDLAWLIHLEWATSEGHPYSPCPRLPGLPGIKETVDRYERKTKRKVENLFYYEVLATWRLAVLYTRLGAVWDAHGDCSAGIDITRSHFEKLKRLIKK